MNHCCSTPREDTIAPSRRRCPVNGLEYSNVPVKTLLHHIRKPWMWNSKVQGYYFCDDPECDVVYFGQDGSQIRRADLRTPVGVKEDSPDAMVCYCFGVSRSEALQLPATREYVIRNTREGLCSCETSNPSGRCCLKDLPAGKSPDSAAGKKHTRKK